jgi:hypothetical protein
MPIIPIEQLPSSNIIPIENLPETQKLPPERTLGEAVVGGIKNIPQSAVATGKQMVSAVTHPIQTFEALDSIIQGAVDKVLPGEQGKEQYFDAAKQAVIDRYGTFENVKKTIEEDPVGFGMDMAGIVTGAGGLVRGAGAVAKVPAIAKVGEQISKVGKALEPVSAVTKAIKSPLKIIPKAIPERIYERVIKAPTKMKPKDRIRAVRTALEEGIMPTPAGADKLWSQVKKIDSQVDDILKASEGKTVSTKEIVSRLDDVAAEFANDPFPSRFLDEIDKLQLEFLERGENIPVRQAQAIKKQAYKTLRKSFDQEVTTVAKASRKGVARGVREEIAAMFPDIDMKQAREGDLLNLHTAIEGAVGRIGNHNLISLSSLLSGAGVGAATQSPYIAIGTTALHQILGNPRVQAKLAIVLDQARRTPLKGIPGETARIIAAESGRITEQE